MVFLCNPNQPATIALERRLLSLDIFRGCIIVAMLLVNNPGENGTSYRMLTHAAWNGYTFADVIAPGFLWVIGISMVFALRRRLIRGEKKYRIFINIIRRSVVIYFLGMAINLLLVYDQENIWSTLNYSGVLQRIAAAYLISGTIYLVAGLKGQIIWILTGCTLYWFLINTISVPGFGNGDLNLEGNVAFYLDNLILGDHSEPGHSIMSLLTSTATISIGVLTGAVLNTKLDERKKCWLLLAISLSLLLTGEVLGLWIPINRRLWTPSFTLLTAGLNTMAFTAIFWLVEVKEYKAWGKFFVIFGLNPIIIFVLSEALRIMAGKKGIVTSNGHWISLWHWVYQAIFLNIASPMNASLMFAVTYVLIFSLLAFVMKQRGWIVKV